MSKIPSAVLRFFSLLFLIIVIFIPSFSNAQLSPECLDEIEAIRNDVNFAIEDARIEALVASIPFQNFCVGSATELHCVTDYSFFEHELETICNDLDGVYLENDYFLNCITQEDGIEYTFENKQIPTCVGKSCNPDNLNAEANGQFLEYEMQLESRGMECEIVNTLRDKDGNELSGGINVNTKMSMVVLHSVFWLVSVAVWIL